MGKVADTIKVMFQDNASSPGLNEVFSSDSEAAHLFLAADGQVQAFEYRGQIRPVANDQLPQLDCTPARSTWTQVDSCMRSVWLVVSRGCSRAEQTCWRCCLFLCRFCRAVHLGKYSPAFVHPSS